MEGASHRPVHASTNTRVGQASIRDLDPADLDSIVRFWYASGDEFLDLLGIDRSLLGTEEDTRQRFLRAIPRDDPDQQSLAFAITEMVNFQATHC